jgi:predicted SprT family Zn-dependent metalloprotease
MYVILHELAHLCNYNKNGYPIYGHGIEFLRIFKVIVQESIKINIYTYQDYQKKPVEYCGLEISSQIV